jgi:V-type H+-transporting ATPase subunit a
MSFPFLFGVMFGDIAHGLILFVFGLSLIFFKNYLSRRNSLFKMIIPHRYLLALMGFFSIYCGLIYNDFLAINLNIFGTCYNIDAAE